MVKNLSINCTENKFKVNKFKIHKLVNALKKELNFSIFFLPINIVTTEQIISINKSYLNHHYSTDIITFNYSGDVSNLDGEIFISSEEAKLNAKRFNDTLENEYYRLVIHGILHLIGYDDSTRSDKIIMKKMENKLLNHFKFI